VCPVVSRWIQIQDLCNEHREVTTTASRGKTDIGANFMILSRLAKGPDSTIGFASGWTKRLTCYLDHTHQTQLLHQPTSTTARRPTSSTLNKMNAESASWNREGSSRKRSESPSGQGRSSRDDTRDRRRRDRSRSSSSSSRHHRIRRPKDYHKRRRSCSSSSFSSSSSSRDRKRSKKHKKKSRSKSKKRRHSKDKNSSSKKTSKKKSKSKSKHSDNSSSSSGEDGPDVKRSVITGKKIKMHVDKDADDLVREKARKDLLKFMNQSL
jgi:hypothetical protein